MSIVYTHNASSTPPHVFVIDVVNGNTVGEFNMTTPSNIVNPQAISLAWATKTLYLADIGDFSNTRTNIALWGIAEPGRVTALTNNGVNATKYPISYPFGPQHAEAIAIHPTDSTIYVITKESSGRLVKLPKPLTGNNLGTNMNKTMPANVTDATFTMDGKWLLMRAEGESATIVYNATSFTLDGYITDPIADGNSITMEPSGSCFLIGGKGQFSPIYRVCLPAKYSPSSPGTPDNENDPTPGLLTKLKDNRINESSGLTVSKIHPNLIWTHNDEGENPQVYGVSIETGQTVATYGVNGSTLVDPESIRFNKITNEIWLADIGDNNNEDGDHPGDSSHRTNCRIVATPEPTSLGSSGTITSVRYPISYPEGPQNSEALLIHPITGSVYIITKAKASNARLYRANLPMSTSSNVLVNQNKSMPALVSDACFTVDGKYALIRCKNNSNTLVYDASTWTSVGVIPSPSGATQCESIDVEANGKSFLIGSEGDDSPIYRVLIPNQWRPSGSGGSSGGGGGDGGGSTSCDSTDTVPADVLDLSCWKVTLPTPIGSTGSPDEIKLPALNTFEKASYFFTECPGPVVVFRAPVNGATTSGSGYPRSELREMKRNTSQEISWNSGSGVHTLECTIAFTKLPGTKPHVVGMQIHGADDDFTVLRLEGTFLYATKGDDTHNKTLMTNYVLGTYLNVKIEASSAGVKYYIDGVLKGTVSGTSTGCYFKTGCYTQANDSGESGKTGTGYGEVKIKSVKVTHT